MTREKAINILQHKNCFDSRYPAKEREMWRDAVKMAAEALRPVSREQIEEGEWQRIPLNMNPEYFTHKYNLRKKCSLCGYVMPDEYPDFNFCPNCSAPMTDEAVDMVMRRLEKLYENNG